MYQKIILLIVQLRKLALIGSVECLKCVLLSQFVAHPMCHTKVSNVIFGKLRSVRELPKLRKLFAITILAVTYPFLTVAYLLAPCSEVSHPTNGTGSRFQRVKQCKRDYTLLEGVRINRAFQNSFQLIFAQKSVSCGRVLVITELVAGETCVVHFSRRFHESIKCFPEGS